METWQIWFAALPGLILFLFGIEQFTSEIQKVAGERFRSFLKSSTKSPARSTALGIMVTAIFQSSTAVGLITMGLVEAGYISFAQSLGILLGSSIGTTVTGQLVALRITGFGPVFIILGFLISILGGRISFVGRPLFYFGLVFFGLALVSTAVEPFKDDPGIISYLSALSNVWVAIAAGFLVTNIFQSSGIFTGLVVLLSGNGLISLTQAVPLILGSNLGTVTPLVASLRMGLFARRMAVAQTLFGVIGVLVVLPVLPQFTSFIVSLGGGAAQEAANAHTVFNVLVSAMLLALLGPFTLLIERLVPGKEEEILFRTVSLNDKLPESNEEALDAIEKELVNLFHNTKMVSDDSSSLFGGRNHGTFQRLLKREALNDYLDERIEAAIIELSSRTLTDEESRRLVLVARMSNALEQLGDIFSSMGYVAKRLADRGESLSPEAVAELESIYHCLMLDMGFVGKSMPRILSEDAGAMQDNDATMRDLINSAYSTHLRRIGKQKGYSASVFVKAISRMELAHSKLREIRKLSEAYTKIVRD